MKLAEGGAVQSGREGGGFQDVLAEAQDAKETACRDLVQFLEVTTHEKEEGLHFDLGDVLGLIQGVVLGSEDVNVLPAFEVATEDTTKAHKRLCCGRSHNGLWLR